MEKWRKWLDALDGCCTKGKKAQSVWSQQWQPVKVQILPSPQMVRWRNEVAICDFMVDANRRKCNTIGYQL